MSSNINSNTKNYKLSSFSNIFSQSLSNLLSPNNTIRKEAENYLNQKKNEDWEFLMLQLINIFEGEDNSTTSNIQVRSLCSVLIKNIILDKDTWFSLSYILQNKIRSNLYLIAKNDQNEQIHKLCCNVLASITIKEFSKSNDNMINYFLMLLKTKALDQKDEYTYLYILSLFFDGFKEFNSINYDIVFDSLEIVLNIININTALLDNSNININKLLNAINIYAGILPFCFKFINDNSQNILFPIIELLTKIVDVFVYAERNELHPILEKTIQIIYDIISSYYSNFISIHNRVLENALKMIQMNTISKNFKHLIIDVMCLICDKELKNKTLVHKSLLTQWEWIIKINLQLLMNSITDFKIKTNEMSITKSIVYLLTSLIKLDVDGSIWEYLLIYISCNILSVKNLLKYLSIWILSACLETAHKEKIISILSPEIKDLINVWECRNQAIEYTMSWVLTKCTEMFPSIFSMEIFDVWIPDFVNIIRNNNQNYSMESRINIAVALGNWIKYYGDEYTTKSSNIFKVYYKLFLNVFLDDCLWQENCQSNLSFYLIRILTNVVQYSSIDFQDSLEIFLNRVLSAFQTLIDDNTNITYDWEENICWIISQIYNKIIRTVDIFLCKKVYFLIIKSFKKRGVPYESGMLCLFNIIILIHNPGTSSLTNSENETIVTNIEDFFFFFGLCFQNENVSPLLMQSALTIISNLCWVKSQYIVKYSKEIVTMIISLLTNNNIYYIVKWKGINCLGDLCLNIPSIWEDYSEIILPTLLSVFDIVFKEYDETEHKQLIIYLTETLSMILLSLQEKNKENLIFCYVKRIIENITLYSNTCKEDREISNGFILWYGDIFYLWNERIREFLTKEHAIQIAMKFKNTGDLKQYKWMDNCIKRYFYRI